MAVVVAACGPAYRAPCRVSDAEVVASAAGGTAWRLAPRFVGGFEATQAESRGDGGLMLRRVSFDEAISIVQSTAVPAPPGLSPADGPLVLPGELGGVAVLSRTDGGFTARLVLADGGPGGLPVTFDGVPLQAEPHRTGLWVLAQAPDGGALLALDGELRPVARRALAPVAGLLQRARLLPLDGAHLGVQGSQSLELVDASLALVDSWPLPQDATNLSALSGAATSPTAAWIGPESSLLVSPLGTPRPERLTSATGIAGFLSAPGITAVVAQETEARFGGPFLALADGAGRKRGPDLALTGSSEGLFVGAAVAIADGGFVVLGAGSRNLTRIRIACE